MLSFGVAYSSTNLFKILTKIAELVCKSGEERLGGMKKP